VLAASLLLVLSPSAYADDMGGLWPVKAQVEAASDVQFADEKTKDMLREVLQPLDDLLGTDLAGTVPDTMPLTEVPMPPQQSGSVPLPPARV